MGLLWAFGIGPTVARLPSMHITNQTSPQRTTLARYGETIETKRERLTPGRGGQVHKAIQELVALWGKRRGYKVTVEKVLATGKRVDVALCQRGYRVAVEIAVHSSVAQDRLWGDLTV